MKNYPNPEAIQACLTSSSRKSFLLALLILQGSFSFSQTVDSSNETHANLTSPPPSKIEEGDMKERPKNNIFLNLLGDGSIASLNYERLFFLDPRILFIALGAGVGFNSLVTLHSDDGFSFSNELFIAVPHHLTVNIGRGRHFFECGIGGAAFTGPRPNPYLPYAVVGYRIQPWHVDKIHFRLYGSYPLQQVGEFDILYIPVGISVGWSF